LRKNAGLTQIEFAKRIGVSQGTLSDIEQGNCNPSIDTVLSIHITAKEIQLLKLFRQMKPKDQEELLQYAAFKMKQNK
jgi:transcriptional regulator with XRE-family HTH domain